MDGKAALLELVARVEQEHSYEQCMALAGFLGYGIGGEPDAVWLDIPDPPWLTMYFSLDALAEDLLADARRCIG